MNGADRLARAIGEPRPDWWVAALCRGVDPELFFPMKGESTRSAKSVCAQCVVREECLEYALSEPVERFGIWGGTSERERRLMRRAKREAS